MIRVKRGKISHIKHKKILNLAKGYYGARSRSYRIAKQSVIKAHQYAYRDRKNKKRTIRQSWILHINAAARHYGMNYSQLIYYLNKLYININRKLLSFIAINNPLAFEVLMKKVLNFKNNVLI